MPCQLNDATYDLISFGHYAMPFDMCPLGLMTPHPIGHYAVPFGLCHIWLMTQFHLDTMLCHLNYAIMTDDAISLGHYAVPFEPC